MTTKKSTTKTKKTAKPAQRKCCSPKACATKSCKAKKSEHNIHDFIVFGLAIVLFVLCGCFGAIAYASYSAENANIASSANHNS